MNSYFNIYFDFQGNSVYYILYALLNNKNYKFFGCTERCTELYVWKNNNFNPILSIDFIPIQLHNFNIISLINKLIKLSTFS